MMPAFSSLMSYRPKRKNKPFRTPFPIRHLQNAPLSPHPYASPPVIDINDGGALETPNREVDEVTDADEKKPPGSPQMKLNLEFNDEPLGNLFPLNFLKADSPFRMSHQPTGTSATGDGDVDRSLGVNGNGRQEENSNVDEEEEEEEEASSSEAVLASLEAMDVSDNFSSPFAQTSSLY
jgi:hypothetical protein